MNRGAIFVDIDGTVNKFEYVDNIIITSIFKKHKVVRFLDGLLWIFNGLDFFSNTMNFFRFRIFVYSLISFTSYKENMREYERLYCDYTFEDVSRNNRLYLSKLKEMGFSIYLVTHSEFVRSFSKKLDIQIQRDKPSYIKEYYTKKEISYVIGNNYFDDLRLPLRLGIKTIYIGRSEFVKRITSKKAKNFLEIGDAVNYIIRNESKK